VGYPLATLVVILYPASDPQSIWSDLLLVESTRKYEAVVFHSLDAKTGDECCVSQLIIIKQVGLFQDLGDQDSEFLWFRGEVAV